MEKQAVGSVSVIFDSIVISAIPVPVLGWTLGRNCHSDKDDYHYNGPTEGCPHIRPIKSCCEYFHIRNQTKPMVEEYG